MKQKRTSVGLFTTFATCLIEPTFLQNTWLAALPKQHPVIM